MLTPVLREGIRGLTWTYQDEQGLLITAPFFAEAREFSEGLAAVKFIFTWGYINTQGEVAISPRFNDASNFCDGLARVKVGSKYGFINRCGEFVISPQFFWVSDFVDGLAKAKVIDRRRLGDIYRNYDVFIDREGKIFNRFFDVISQDNDNSLILYQQTSCQIAFSFDRESVAEMTEWFRGIAISHSHFKVLQIVDNDTRHYRLNVRFIKERAYLTITRDTMEQTTPTQFSKTFKMQSSTELVYLQTMGNFSGDIHAPQQLVLKIEGEFYQRLVNWKDWASTEAFTGRYSYDFFNDSADAGIYVCVTDSITHQEFWSVNSWRNYSYDDYDDDVIMQF